MLIVGAGGLGCPAALYLTGAGVGTLGLVDGDEVDVSNLHRQVLHRTANVGKRKVDSAIEYLREYDPRLIRKDKKKKRQTNMYRLNPHPTYIAHPAHLTPQDAPSIFAAYDLILDCTDNPATRYLISDTAVLLHKPLVSASALRTEGQLTVLNNPPQPPGDPSGGPCYRCVFPRPPPPTSILSCADGGIVGPVVGTMGVLQALEAIKVLTTPPTPPALHIFSAYSSPLFRTIKLRSRRSNCAVCSAQPTVTLETLQSGSTDYVFFCGGGSVSPEALLAPDERISPQDYQQSSSSSADPAGIVIDVREKVQFDICSLENSINVPISTILSSSSSSTTTTTNPNTNNKAEDLLPPWLPSEITTSPTSPIYVVCRQGNDSQVAVKKLKALGLDRGGRRIVDVMGGLRAYRRVVDPGWPEY